eukprot:6275721-Amphidinium_carterae.1
MSKTTQTTMNLFDMDTFLWLWGLIWGWLAQTLWVSLGGSPLEKPCVHRFLLVPLGIGKAQVPSPK